MAKKKKTTSKKTKAKVTQPPENQTISNTRNKIKKWLKAGNYQAIEMNINSFKMYLDKHGDTLGQTMDKINSLSENPTRIRSSLMKDKKIFEKEVYTDETCLKLLRDALAKKPVQVPKVVPHPLKVQTPMDEDLIDDIQEYVLQTGKKPRTKKTKQLTTDFNKWRKKQAALKKKQAEEPELEEEEEEEPEEEEEEEPEEEEEEEPEEEPEDNESSDDFENFLEQDNDLEDG
jgi:hypothetical protein